MFETEEYVSNIEVGKADGISYDSWMWGLGITRNLQGRALWLQSQLSFTGGFDPGCQLLKKMTDCGSSSVDRRGDLAELGDTAISATNSNVQQE